MADIPPAAAVGRRQNRCDTPEFKGKRATMKKGRFICTVKEIVGNKVFSIESLCPSVPPSLRPYARPRAPFPFSSRRRRCRISRLSPIVQKRSSRREGRMSILDREGCMRRRTERSNALGLSLSLSLSLLILSPSLSPLSTLSPRSPHLAPIHRHKKKSVSQSVSRPRVAGAVTYRNLGRGEWATN